MTERSISAKLLLKPGQRIAVIGAPDDYGMLVGGLPAGATVSTTPNRDADVIHLFVEDRAALAARWPAVAAVLGPETLLWISYPKRGPGVTTDLTRDVGWAPVRESGYDPVTQVAVDATWSAMRYRHDPALRAAREARGARVGRD
ncbi:MAG TPA: hypothetical protein VEG29_01595 [Candidatus Binatia bacterium]|nr:hypothetical protein [Candidatus Binatia bacterium]